MLRILYDFLNLIFPNICVICDEKLVFGEKTFCTNCLSDFPKTDFSDLTDNPVARLFWGRVQIEGATSFFYFDRGSKYRKLLHKLKYRGQKEIGYELGKMFGEKLKTTALSNIDLIIPVPLHKNRLRSRGYNQSEHIALGLGSVLNKPVAINIIERKIYNVSQTGKGRFERWENVDGIFIIVKPDQLKNMHCLLVDDIITTGATIEACVQAVKNSCNCQISVCSLATTK